MLVYSFVNKITSECMYIGSTIDMNDRMKTHRYDCKTLKLELYNVIREITWESVEINIVSENEDWTVEEMKIEERKQIEMFAPLYNIYNPMRTEEENIQMKKDAKKACYAAKPEQYAATAKAYNESHKVEIATKAKEYREANKVKLLAQKKAYRDANKDTINAKQKVNRAANPEAKEKEKVRLTANKDKYNENRRIARLVKQEAAE